MNKLLHFLFPERMAALQHAELVERTYAAALPSDYSKGAWRTSTESPDGTIAGHYGPEMRKAGRYLDENYDLVTAALNHFEDEVAGVRIEPMTPDEGLNDAIRALHDEWWAAPTTRSQDSGLETERLVIRSWVRDGEIFSRHVISRDAFPQGGPVPYRIRLYESEECPINLIEDNPRVLLGIEVDPVWEYPVRYRMLRVHPGDNIDGSTPQFIASGGIAEIGETVGVPVDQMIHLKHTKRVNQTRGVTAFHSVIRRLEDIQDYEESERIAARVAAAFCAAIYRDAAAPTGPDRESGDRSFQMASGMVFDKLKAGERIEVIDTKRPSSELEPFMDNQARRFSGGIGGKHSSISRAFHQGNYSSMRQELVEARPRFQFMQQQLILRWRRPVYEAFIDAAQLAGLLPRSVPFETLATAAYLPPSLAWIDPKSEIEAYLLEWEAGLISKSQIMVLRGRNPREVRDQLELEAANEPDETTEPEDEPTELRTVA